MLTTVALGRQAWCKAEPAEPSPAVVQGLQSKHKLTTKGTGVTTQPPTASRLRRIGRIGLTRIPAARVATIVGLTIHGAIQIPAGQPHHGTRGITVAEATAEAAGLADRRPRAVVGVAAVEAPGAVAAHQVVAREAGTTRSI